MFKYLWIIILLIPYLIWSFNSILEISFYPTNFDLWEFGTRVWAIITGAVVLTIGFMSFVTFIKG